MASAPSPAREARALPRNVYPGWDDEAEYVANFIDIRDHQRRLKAAALSLTMEADESTTGPASLLLIDPDGNPILIDQHVDSPRTSLSNTDTYETAFFYGCVGYLITLRE